MYTTDSDIPDMLRLYSNFCTLDEKYGRRTLFTEPRSIFWLAGCCEIPGSSPGGGGGGCRQAYSQFPEFDVKRELLHYVFHFAGRYDGVDVTNFTSSWRSGLAFNAIINRFR